MNKVILTNKAPLPIGPYSQAIQSGNMLFVSGMIALNPDSNELILEDISQETDQVLKNLSAVVEAAGFSLRDVVKCTIFLSDMENFSSVNLVYAKYFNEAPPARETVQVSNLPKYVNVEISCIASRHA